MGYEELTIKRQINLSQNYVKLLNKWNRIISNRHDYVDIRLILNKK